MPPSKKAKKEADIFQRVKGPNSAHAHQNRDGIMVVKALERAHDSTPGDLYHCQCCGEWPLNIYQHQFFKCEKSQYYLQLQDKFREAYLYLSLRNYEKPATYDPPGHMIMFKGTLVTKLMDKFPITMLEQQSPRWNVLMPIMTDVNGSGTYRTTGKTFFDHLNEIIESLQTDNGDQKFWIQSLTRPGPHVTWELHHEPHRPTVGWTREEQMLMETTRYNIVQKWSGHVRYFLPCTQLANIQGNPDSNTIAAATFQFLNRDITADVGV